MTKADHKSHALQVRHALWNLQKEVLTSLKEEFDLENGYQSAPTEWFQALTNSARYAWLRELTSLMADVDIMTELDFVTEQHAATARAEIDRLLIDHANNTSDFTVAYKALLLSGVALLPLHATLRSSVQHLPKAEMSKEQSLAERKAWHEEHRHQSRKKRN